MSEGRDGGINNHRNGLQLQLPIAEKKDEILDIIAGKRGAYVLCFSIGNGFCFVNLSIYSAFISPPLPM